MHFQLLKVITAIKANRTLKAEMRIHLALHFIRHQTRPFNTTALLKKSFPTRLHPSFSALVLKYESLLKADTFLTLFQTILSLHPCRRRDFITLVLDGKFQNNSCWTWYWAIPSFPPKNILEWAVLFSEAGAPYYMCPHLRVFSLQWIWFTAPGMPISSEMHQNKTGKQWNESVTWWFMKT